MAEEHQTGADEIIDIFPAVLIPDAGGPALANDNSGVEVSESARGKDRVRPLYPFALAMHAVHTLILFDHGKRTSRHGLIRHHPRSRTVGRHYRHRIHATELISREQAADIARVFVGFHRQAYFTEAHCSMISHGCSSMTS